MGIETDATGGFGFCIDADDLDDAIKRANGPEYDPESGLFGYLPAGFQYASFNDGYDTPRGVVVLVDDDIAASALRGESPPPDMQPLLEWAKRFGIKFSEEEPRIHYLTYTC
jgi:hypothetical protein